MMTRMHNAARAMIAAATAALLVGALLPAVAAAATKPTKFDVVIGDECVSGVGIDDATLKLVWRDSAGGLKAKVTMSISPSGTWEYCSASEVIQAGDRVKATVGSITHLLIIPELTLFQNRVTDIYKGRGPAGQMVRLICGLSNGFEPCVQTWRIRVNAEGKWSYKPGWDVLGRDNMYLRWRSEAGDKVNVISIAPYVTATIGKAGFIWATRPGASATVVIRDPSTLDVRGTATTVGSPLDGSFIGQFRNQLGQKVKVRAGDILSSDIAADLDYVIGDIHATADTGTQHVTGQCPEEMQFYVIAYHNGHEIGFERWWTDEGGTFDADFSGEPTAMVPGDRVRVGCQLETGDWIQKWFAAT